MTPLVTLPMQSYQYAKYAEPVVCFVCDFDNNFDAEECRKCGAPMALTHQADAHKVPPQMVSVIGPPGSGKTVYLGMLLDLLARRTEGIRALARGAFSVSLQQETVEWLAACQYPPATSTEPTDWNWVHAQVHLARRRDAREVVLADLPGEAMLSHIEREQQQPAVAALLARSTAAMVMIDVTQIEAGGSDAEYFAVKALTNLAELHKRRRSSWQRRPVAIVFTKADDCESCCDDPVGYAERQCSSLAQFCHQRFSKVEFFATSVARSMTTTDGVEVPLRIEPRGIIDPFEWLVTRMKRG